MEICNEHQSEIVFISRHVSDTCPACEEIKDLKEEVGQLEDQIEELESTAEMDNQRILELEDEVDRLEGMTDE